MRGNLSAISQAARGDVVVAMMCSGYCPGWMDRKFHRILRRFPSSDVPGRRRAQPTLLFRTRSQPHHVHRTAGVDSMCHNAIRRT
jgi:hypothetical protein